MSLALADYQLHVLSRSQLNLSNNRLGPDGAKALVPALVRGSLTHLDLGGNELGSEGAKALAAALKMNEACTLKKLNADSSSYNHPDLVAACKLRGIALT